MADIKIREGSLELWYNNQKKVDDPKGHKPGQAVHLRFYDAENANVANYVFVKGQLMGVVGQELGKAEKKLLELPVPLPESTAGSQKDPATKQ